MRRIAVLAVIAALCLSGADKKKKQFEIKVLETAAHRADGIISVDATVRNTGERSVEGLILLFDFMAAGSKVISTQQTPVEEELLEAGQQATVHVQLRDEVRAVRYRVNSTDKAGHDFNVLDSGPYLIE